MSGLLQYDIQIAVLEMVPLLVADMDTGEILHATQPLEQMFGYKVRGELRQGKTVEDLLSPELREQHKQHRATYAETQQARTMGANLFLTGMKKDGTVFPVEIGLVAAVITNVRCVIAYVVDMTGRKP